MLKSFATAAAALIVASGAAFAQAPAPTSGSAPAATPAPAATTAPAATNKVAPPAATSAPAKPAAAVVPAAKPAAVVALDAGGEAKFKGFDKNKNGVLDGAEVTGFSAVMGKVDADKDGKVSRVEFAAALKGGLIK